MGLIVSLLKFLETEKSPAFGKYNLKKIESNSCQTDVTSSHFLPKSYFSKNGGYSDYINNQTIGRKIVFGKIIEAGILKSTSGKAIAAGNY